MAKFQKRIDIWTLSDEERAKLQPGQHITAGTDGARGRWCGMRRSGVSVAAWEGNAGGYPKGRAAYFRALRGYAMQ